MAIGATPAPAPSPAGFARAPPFRGAIDRATEHGRGRWGATEAVADPRIVWFVARAPKGVSYRVDFPDGPCPQGSEDDEAPPVAGPFLMARPRLELGTPRFSVIHACAGHLAYLSGIRPDVGPDSGSHIVGHMVTGHAWPRHGSEG